MVKPIEQITYTGEPDNCREVIDWLTARNLFAPCDRCKNTGEYEGEHGTLTCQPCISRLIAVRVVAGISYVDWGDTITFDGYATKIIRAGTDD